MHLNTLPGEQPVRGYLIRVGIDQTFGGWNCPVDTETREYVYVPIPEPRALRAGLGRAYGEALPPLERFSQARGLDLQRDLRFPAALREAWMHLDPDFENLTYGDAGRRARLLSRLTNGDLLAFYAGLRSIAGGPLVYALVGVYVIEEAAPACSAAEHRWHENAHTRRLFAGEDEIVIRAQRALSGRLERCIEIGERRARAYRVREPLIEAWGGLSVRDGFLQRSAQPPALLDPPRFLDWLQQQGVVLVRTNW